MDPKGAPVLGEPTPARRGRLWVVFQQRGSSVKRDGGPDSRVSAGRLVQTSGLRSGSDVNTKLMDRERCSLQTAAQSW